MSCDEQVMLIYAFVCASFLSMIKCVKENSHVDNTLFLWGVVETLYIIC